MPRCRIQLALHFGIEALGSGDSGFGFHKRVLGAIDQQQGNLRLAKSFRCGNRHRLHGALHVP